MINTNEKNMPNISLDFDLWLSQFNIRNEKSIQDFVDRFKNIRNLNIEFSDKVIIKEIGHLADKNIQKKLKGIWKLNQNAKDLIKQINSIEDLIDISDTLSIEISNYNEIDYADVYDYIMYLVSISKNHYYVLATHDIFDNIVFYPNAISIVADSFISEEQVYELAFIEQLYYLYYDYISKMNKNNKFCDSFKRCDYISDVVKDSLACYNTLNYCNKFEINKKLFSHIFRANVIIHPAAGVKSILNLNHYTKVFNKSIYSADEAIKELFKNNEDIAYSVINREYLKKFM